MQQKERTQGVKRKQEDELTCKNTRSKIKAAEDRTMKQEPRIAETIDISNNDEDVKDEMHKPGLRKTMAGD